MKSMKDTGREFDATVNERLKEVRLALGYSQRKFCAQIPLSSSHYANIELGERRVNDRLVSLVCTRFRVREQFLVAGEGPMFDNANDHKLEQIMRIFRELPPDFQEYLLIQVQNLIELANKNKH